MSEPDPEQVPFGDPFAADDPEAYERERRRALREAKRRGRDERRSLGDLVSGALDDAAAKGREAVVQGRERVAQRHEPPAEGAEPPPLRRPTAAPRQPEPVPPLRPEPVPPSDPEPPRQPEQVAPAEPEPPRRPDPPAPLPATPVETEAVAVPPPPVGRAGAAQPAPPRRAAPPSPRRPAPPNSPAASAPASIWRRRIAAVLALLVLLIGAGYAVSKVADREEPAPVPKGPATLKTVSVTVPEGLSGEEMAPIAKDAGLKGDYEKAIAKQPKGFDLKETGAPADAGLEGFLFPATYELEKKAPVEDLVGNQLAAYEDNIAKVDLKAAAKKNLSEYDVVTIASMIEREVQVPEERPLVAAVIYNRLADGEPLGIDATLRYEVGFDQPLTESELASDSPYNTRIVPGLPPTPIGNPGFDSLKAAADPANVDFKYYVFKPGSCNEHSFTADYDEFLALQAEYQAALEEQGGQPSDC